MKRIIIGIVSFILMSSTAYSENVDYKQIISEEYFNHPSPILMSIDEATTSSVAEMQNKYFMRYDYSLIKEVEDKYGTNDPMTKLIIKNHIMLVNNYNLQVSTRACQINSENILFKAISKISAPVNCSSNNSLQTNQIEETKNKINEIIDYLFYDKDKIWLPSKLY